MCKIWDQNWNWFFFTFNVDSSFIAVLKAKITYFSSGNNFVSFFYFLKAKWNKQNLSGKGKHFCKILSFFKYTPSFFYMVDWDCNIYFPYSTVAIARYFYDVDLCTLLSKSYFIPTNENAILIALVPGTYSSTIIQKYCKVHSVLFCFPWILLSPRLVRLCG